MWLAFSVFVLTLASAMVLTSVVDVAISALCCSVLLHCGVGVVFELASLSVSVAFFGSDLSLLVSLALASPLGLVDHFWG